MHSRLSIPRLFGLSAVLAIALPAVPLADTPASNRIAVSLLGEHRVALLDIGTREMVSIPTGLDPAGLAVVGDSLFVANRGTERAPGSSLTEIDLRQRRAVRTIFACEACAPTALLSGGDGELFVTGQRHRAVLRFEPPYDAPARAWMTSWGLPVSLVAVPGSDLLLVGMDRTNEVGVIDPGDSRARRLALDLWPRRPQARPGHAEVWVGTSQGWVYVLTPDVLAGTADPERVKARTRILDIAFDGGGSRALVAAASVPGVVVIDAERREVVKVNTFPKAVRRVLRQPGTGDRFALLLVESTDVVITELDETGTLRERERIDLGAQPEELVWLPSNGMSPSGPGD